MYWKAAPYRGTHIQIDDDGLRRTWRAPSEAKDPFRIFVFGGSTTWGRGARDDRTIPSFVAKALAMEPAVPAVVTNFGQSGWVSTQEVIALELELRRGNLPDVVVFYDGVNDVFSAYQSDVAGIPQNESKRQLDFESFERAAVARLLDRLAVVRVARRLVAGHPLAPPVARSPSDRSALATGIVDAYEGNMDIVTALASRFEFRPLFFWQPVVWSKAGRTELEAEVVDAFAPLRPLYDATYGEVRSRPSLRARESFADVSDALDGFEGSAFFDYCHVTESANAAIASRIASRIRSILETPAHD